MTHVPLSMPIHTTTSSPHPPIPPCVSANAAAGSFSSTRASTIRVVSIIRVKLHNENKQTKDNDKLRCNDCC
jgi:hypothetical protein